MDEDVLLLIQRWFLFLSSRGINWDQERPGNSSLFHSPLRDIGCYVIGTLYGHGQSAEGGEFTALQGSSCLCVARHSLMRRQGNWNEIEAEVDALSLRKVVELAELLADDISRRGGGG